MERRMREAIDLATGTTSHPNPRVGALVLDTAGEVVGRGVHEGPGFPHAEVVALAEAGERAKGGTLVVTLEPCDHAGRTPPCTDAILSAGVAGVVIGGLDPDDRVSGSGAERLRAAGLKVATDVAGEAVEALDPGYFHQRRTGRPRVTLKTALTLDGQTAAADGSSRWITSPEARRDGHLLRAASDAVMVGAGTIRADDPALTVRLPGYLGPQPRAVIVAGKRPLPPGAQVWERAPLVFTPDAVDIPAEVVALPGASSVDLAAVMQELGKRSVVDLLVEGGATLAGSLLRAGLIDRGVFYLAGKLAGGVGLPAMGGSFVGVDAARPITIASVDRVGPDLRVEFTMEDR